VIKSERVRWAGHAAHTGKMRRHAEFESESLKEINRFRDLVEDKILLKRY
jgi:hypothetical protein